MRGLCCANILLSGEPRRQLYYVFRLLIYRVPIKYCMFSRRMGVNWRLQCHSHFGYYGKFSIRFFIYNRLQRLGCDYCRGRQHKIGT